MAIKATNQVTLIDLTDGYSVILTNESYTFLGTTDSVQGTQTTTCMVQALCGDEVTPCSVGQISTPSGLSIVSDKKTPNPTLTITATSALTKSGSVTIPVIIGDITINKLFSYSIAFKGQSGTSVTVSKTDVSYQVGTSGTEAPSGQWLPNPPSTPAGQFLWTKTVVTYSDGKSTTAYSVSRSGVDGVNGSSVTIKNKSVTYQVGTSGTVAPTGSWSTSIPSTKPGQYLWTKTTVTYSDGKSTESYSVSRNGSNGQDGKPGADGKDAIVIDITSSNGTIFKNTAIATTLTAHVYKGGIEIEGAELTKLGTIKWYKDDTSAVAGTGQTLTITSGDVSNKASYTAQLEA